MTTAEVGATATVQPACQGVLPLHVDPPTSPSRVLCEPIWRLVIVSAVFAALAIAAVIDDGRLLLHVDEPTQRFAIDSREAWLNSVFRAITSLGDTYVILPGGAVLAMVAWRRCRVVAALVVIATLSRPLVEFTLKELVGRERPTISQLVNGAGYSFPSGHPMAAASLWLMLPVVVSLYSSSRRVWWASIAMAVTTVGLIGVSRVYLGVHWTSDVIAGYLAGAILVAGLDAAYRSVHARRACTAVKLPT